MSKTNFLRNVFLISLALAIGLPLNDYLYVYPSYRELLIKQTESEAGRFVRFLVATKQLEQIDLDRQRLASSVTSEIIRMKEDALLVKLRIFSSQGRIIYSTQPKEIGQVNTSDYFVNLVKKGEVYSKVVQKNELTADGDLVTEAVVETYVPIMAGERFHGAVEVYYDITASQQQLSALNLRATLLLISVSLAFLGLLMVSLRRAGRNFSALQAAELALHEANESLELRVSERTQQLSKANIKLLAEVEERARAEEALTEALTNVSDARDKIDTILTSVADGLIVTDSEDRIVLMNRVAEGLFDVSDWQGGALLADVVSLPELMENIDRVKVQLTDGLKSEFDLYLKREAEEDKVYAVRASVLWDEQGVQRGTVLLLQDVTMVRGIERMKSEFVSMAAHELRTPLTMILGYSELLVENTSFSAQEMEEFYGIINDKAVALTAILDDLLDVTRIEEGRPLELQLQPVELQRLAESALAEIKLHHADSHQFKIAFPETKLILQADQGRLLQVLQNLLNNAVKYSPDGGEIELSVKQVGKEVEIAVSDQGIGMTAEQVKHAFERFYRADTSDAGIRGTGLGLSIVEYIVQAHGGRVSIDSSMGEGSRVSCRFPLYTQIQV